MFNIRRHKKNFLHGYKFSSLSNRFSANIMNMPEDIDLVQNEWHARLNPSEIQDLKILKYPC